VKESAVTGPTVLQLSRVRAPPPPAGRHWRTGEPYTTPLDGYVIAIIVIYYPLVDMCSISYDICQ
jgi:hypothetical protein